MSSGQSAMCSQIIEPVGCRLDELKTALGYLAELKQEGPVFVHCVAAMERSPLVCLGWLVQEHNMTSQAPLTT